MQLGFETRARKLTFADDNPWGNLRPLKHMRYNASDRVAREEIVETAVIVDKEYVDQWRKDFPTSKGTFRDISLWITNSLNWVGIQGNEYMMNE